MESVALDPRDRGGKVQPLLIARSLKKYFPMGRSLLGKRSYLHAVDDVSFSIGKRETLGVVGESGCGKSTLARVLLDLMSRDAGELIFDGEAVGTFDGISRSEFRKSAQMVFQDSYASLNPRLTLEETLTFGPVYHGVTRAEAVTRANDLLHMVGLEPRRYAAAYPHELSGGQRQRVNIARALSLDPRLVVMDEPVSALDKSVEAQVLNLLIELRQRMSLTYVFISHDLNVVRFLSDRVMVMYLGKIVEIGPVDAVFNRPKHPYTLGLLASRLSTDPDKRVDSAPLSGDPPSPINPPLGCRFASRCAFTESVCHVRTPVLTQQASDEGHSTACHMVDIGSGHSKAAQA